MRIISGLIAGLVVALLAAAVLPAPVLGDNDDKAEVTGVVVSVSADGSFQFREFSSNLIWSAVLRRDAKIKLKGGKDRDERRYSLKPGDIVEVEGRLLTTRTVLAKEIKVLAHTAAQPSGIVLPQPGQPAGTGPAPGLTVPAIVKTIGIGAAVKAFSPALNTFINNLLQARDAQTQQTTKVVPILSIKLGVNTPGQAAVGAAQVSGPKASVDKVQAVAVLDANYQGSFSVRALVPVDSLEPWKRLVRVPSVGVSAIIDLKL
jgi:hypothetical protein